MTNEQEILVLRIVAPILRSFLEDMPQICPAPDTQAGLGVWAGVRFYFAYPILKKLHRFFVKTIFSWNWVHRKGINSTEYWNLSFFIPVTTIRSQIVICYDMMFTMVTAIPCAK